MQLKKTIQSILLLVMLFSARPAVAQNSIVINTTLLPPYSPYFSDYLVYENKATIILTGPNAIGRRVFLRGTVTGDNGVSLITKSSYRPTTPIVINSATTILKGIDLEEYFNWENVNVYGIDLPKVAQGDGLPEGNYTICLRAFDFDSGFPLSADAPSGCVTINIRSVEPPIINFPRCGANILANPAQNIVFSWNPPPGAPPTTRYLIKIAEMPIGMDNYNHAINTLTSPAFFEKDLAITTYTYTLADAPLSVGRTYAFRVEAYDPQNRVNFRNNGASEVCYFVYGQTAADDEKIPTKEVKVKQIASRNLLLPTTKIKGKLVWAFHRDYEVDDNQIDNSLEVERDLNGLATSFSNYAVNKDGSYSAALDAARKGAIAEPATGNPSLGGYVSVVNNDVMSRASNMVVVLTKQQQSENAIQSMAGKRHFPYASISVRVYLGVPYKNLSQPNATPTGAGATKTASGKHTTVSNVSSVFNGDVGLLASSSLAIGKEDKYGRILLGVATTDEDGNFSIDAIDKMLWKNTGDIFLSLEFDHPHFIFATREIKITTSSNEDIDLGEHLGIAKTYNLRIKVQTAIASIGDKGTALNDATVKILRKKTYYDWYPHLQKEGNGFTKTPNTDSGYVVVAEGKAGMNFARLFYNSVNRYADEYRIKVASKDYILFDQPIKKFESAEEKNVIAGNNVSYTQKQIVEVIKLKAPTFVSGVLVTKGGDVPVVNTKIELIAGAGDGEKLVKAVVTDSAGNFSFDNIEPNAGVTYRLKINDAALGVIYPSLKDGNADDPQQIVLGFYGAQKRFNPLRISGNLITVKGIVKNDEKAIVPGAILKWKQGGKSFLSADDGSFVTAVVPGKHILIATKIGYRQTEIPIEVKADANTKIKGEQGAGATVLGGNAWANAVATVTTNSKIQYGNNTVSGNTAQFTQQYGYSSANAFLRDLIGDKDQFLSSTVLNVGDVIIKRFYVKVSVKDAATSSAIANAQVTDRNSEKINTTDVSGNVIVSDATGAAPTLIVKGPAGSLYITKEITFDLAADKDTAQVAVTLEKGVAVSGQVLLNGAGVKQANVFVEGMEFLQAQTDNSGNYTLALKSGEYNLLATKQGLQGDKKSTTIANAAVTQNFNLSDPGFDASKILGFDVEIYESKPGANANEKIVSGAFIKVPGNTLFSLPANFKLPFSNQKVNVISGKAMPVGDAIATTVSEIPFNLFDYLPLKLKNSTGIVVKKHATDGSVGVIVGTALLDVSGLFNKVAGLKIPSGVEIGLSGNGADKKEITAFISNGALPLDGNNLKLLGLNDNSGEWEMFGTKLKINFGKSFVFKDGLQLAGSVSFADYPVIGNKTFFINKFKINAGGDVQFDVACNLNEQIDFSLWKLRLGNIQVNNFGVTASGAVDLSIPETDKVSVAFNNLSFSKSGISGGSFNIYSEAIASALKQFETAIQQAQSAYNTLLANANAAASQIDQASDALNQAKANFQNRLDQLLATSNNEISIVNIIAYQPGKVPFSLNKVPGGNHYTLQGSGTFGLKQYLKDRIKLNYFAVSTDGNFAFIAPVNFKQDFLGLAEFEINEFGLNTIKKSLTVGGKLYLKIPGFGIGAGAVITYYQGGRAELSGISFKMDVGPVGTFAGGLTIKDNGFSGMGQLKIAGAFGIAGSFLYEKQDRGFRFGVSFEVQPNPIIPVGIVAIGVKGGGFEINTNPGRESVAISVKGSLSLLVDPTATLGINPLEVKITVGAGGPILEGKGTIVAATIPLGEGGFKIDIPNRYFTAYLELGKSLNLIPSAPLQAEAGARISASFQSGNQYFMLAMYNYLNIANIVKSKTNIAFAWGLRKNQGTDEDKYVAFIPDNYLQNGKLFGFGFSTSTEFGIPRERAIKFEIPLIVSASGYYYNRSGVEFYGNFKTSTYGFALESRFEAGAELKIIKIISIGGGLNIAGRIAGGYGQGNWFFEASLSAGIYGYINCETDCRNEICTAFFIPVGFTVCVNGKVQMSLSSQNGFRSSISLN